MTKFWPDGWDYNESIKDYPDWWKEQSRNNEYTVVDGKGEIKNILYPLKEYKIRSILDYGCGYSKSIEKSLKKYERDDKVIVTEYDPFILGKDVRPKGKFDMVVCHNVIGASNIKYATAIVNDLLNYSKQIVSIKIPTSKELLKDHINAVNRANDKIILDISISPSSEIYPSDELKKISEFYIYFLLRKVKLE